MTVDLSGDEIGLIQESLFVKIAKLYVSFQLQKMFGLFAY